MVEQVKESPTLEGKPAEPKKVEKSEDEIKSLLETLEKVGVKSPQHLEGIAQNAREFGNVTNLLGQERQRVADLERKFQELETRAQPKQSLDYSQYDTGQTVDLEKFIRKAIRDERDTERKEMAELQKRQLQAWNTIQADEDYGNVKPIWEDKLKDPNFVFKITSGVTDPIREYQETVRDFYKGIAMKSKEAIEKLSGAKKVAPPHVESGERGGNLVSEGEGKTHPLVERYRQLKKKTETGGILSSEEELELARIATYGLFPTSPRT